MIASHSKCFAPDREVFFFDNEGKNLFAVVHKPEEGLKRGFVFCHPYGEEKQLTYRILVRVAQLLREIGFWVLRFDSRGYGDSEGDFEDATLETQLEDTIAATALLRDEFGVPNISLLGLRYGAAVAALAAEKIPSVQSLVLWSPLVDGKKYIKELVRKRILAALTGLEPPQTMGQILHELEKSGKIELEGQCFTQQLHAQLSQTSLPKQISAFREPVLIASIDSKDKDTTRLQQAYAANGACCDLIRISEKLYWDSRSLYRWHMPETLFKETLRWLEGTHPSSAPS